MIVREDILSMEFLKKTEYSGCHAGMRYRLEGVTVEEGKKLRVTVWPEPFNYFSTPEQDKESVLFDFCEEGIVDAIVWMNDKLIEKAKLWEGAGAQWGKYAQICGK